MLGYADQDLETAIGKVVAEFIGSWIQEASIEAAIEQAKRMPRNKDARIAVGILQTAKALAAQGYIEP